MPPQQPDRQASASPAAGMNGVPMQQRPSNDYYMNAMNSSGMNPNAMNPAAMVQAQMHNRLQPSPRPQSPAHTQYPMPSNGSQGRPSLTSNPSSGYSNPPQILEPPATNGQQQTTSNHNSPHLNGAMGGWQSPHNGIPTTGDYAYPADVNSNGYTAQPTMPQPTMYYHQNAVQRPHSTGPIDHYNQMRGPEMWAQQQQ